MASDEQAVHYPDVPNSFAMFPKSMLRFSRCLFELRIEERMRDLGIEVDE